jgi:hypothetical protein
LMPLPLRKDVVGEISTDPGGRAPVQRAPQRVTA